MVFYPGPLNATLANPDVENLGSVGVDIREGWWYPDYVADLCPGLPDWRALLEEACVDALSSPEAPGKIRYISAPPDWSPYDEERVSSLNLPVDIVPARDLGGHGRHHERRDPAGRARHRLRLRSPLALRRRQWPVRRVPDPAHDYPYFTGYAEETGAGEGTGCNLNAPLPDGSEGEAFLAALRDVLAKVRQFSPDFLVVPLGVDGFAGESVGKMSLAAEDFARIGEALAELGMPTVFMMEGGYSEEALEACVPMVLQPFRGN
jgi:hypothetical protein